MNTKVAQGKFLREARRQAGLTQAQFAQALGVHRVTVSDWERGRKPIPEAVEIIARLLDESPELLPKIERWRGIR